MIREESIREPEIFANMEMSKVNEWSKRKKLGFNEAKSKTMLISRRKMKKAKQINFFLNNKRIEKDKKNEIFRYNY